MEELNIKLTINELNTVLESLGHLPYLRVYELVSKIQLQAREQLNDNEPKSQKESKSKVETN